MAENTKTLLTLTPYEKVSDTKFKLQQSQKISVLINPNELSVDYQVEMKNFSPLGSTGYGKKFKGFRPAKISFDLIFDGTGAVAPQPSSFALDVVAQIKAVMDVVYTYEGDQHEPNIVQLVWGNLSYDARLERFSTKYTLFKANGRPLRATASLGFSSYKTIEQSKAEANQQSPDMSHIVVVQAGDTLPLLCQRVYGDSRYYAQVARFNKLVQFRVLPPGLRLHFPPLE